LFFNVKLIFVGISLIIFDLVQLPLSNSGGHIAHLGGALVGYYSGIKIKNGYNILNYFKIFQFKTIEIIKTKKKSMNSKRPTEKNQKQIDRILDKINESGYDSLTKDEKNTLNEASKE